MGYRRQAARIRERRVASARLDGESGAVLVEAALILPIFLLFIFGIIEFGLLLRAHNEVANAAGTAARVASAEPKSGSFISDTKEKAVALISDIAKNADAGNPDQIIIYQAESFTAGGQREDSTAAAAQITSVDTSNGYVGCTPGGTCVAGQGVGQADPQQCAALSLQNCVVYTLQSNGQWLKTYDNWPPLNINACPLPQPVTNTWQDTRTRGGVYIRVTNSTLTALFRPILGSMEKVKQAVVFRMEPLPSAVPCAYGK